MKLTVGIYAANTQGQVGKVGEIHYDGKRITAKPADTPMLVRMAKTPLKLLGEPKPIDPKKEPERFIRSLHLRYRSPYLTALGVTEQPARP
jgi:hypothetical protein